MHIISQYKYTTKARILFQSYRTKIGNGRQVISWMLNGKYNRVFDYKIPGFLIIYYSHL